MNLSCLEPVRRTQLSSRLTRPQSNTLRSPVEATQNRIAHPSWFTRTNLFRLSSFLHAHQHRLAPRLRPGFLPAFQDCTHPAMKALQCFRHARLNLQITRYRPNRLLRQPWTPVESLAGSHREAACSAPEDPQSSPASTEPTPPQNSSRFPQR